MIPLAIFDAAEFFQWFVDNANYTFVFVFMVIESSFIPFPSEVVVPPAAYLACSNAGAGAGMNVFAVVLVATLGAMVGAFINYYLALWIGRPVVYAFADSKLGHILLINKSKVEKAEAYFDRHGAISTFIGRLIPAIRQLISIPAGIARMNIWQFAIFTFLGAFLWNSILGALGFWLSETVSPEQLFEKVEQYNRYLTWAGYALAGVCLIFIVVNFFRKDNGSKDKSIPFKS
ncbi:MAG: DedA family protein [Muribaculaceae bacterium]|nr:DedA family protein [Muribaculaceae bacterium]